MVSLWRLPILLQPQIMISSTTMQSLPNRRRLHHRPIRAPTWPTSPCSHHLLLPSQQPTAPTMVPSSTITGEASLVGQISNPPVLFRWLISITGAGSPFHRRTQPPTAASAEQSQRLALLQRWGQGSTRMGTWGLGLFCLLSSLGTGELTSISFPFLESRLGPLWGKKELPEIPRYWGFFISQTSRGVDELTYNYFSQPVDPN